MSLQDPIRRSESGLWLRFPLGLLYKRMVRRGDWYVKLDGTAAQLAREAVRHAPPSYRWLGRSVAAAEVDDQAGGRPEWHAAKASQRPGDRICRSSSTRGRARCGPGTLSSAGASRSPSS